MPNLTCKKCGRPVGKGLKACDLEAGYLCFHAELAFLRARVAELESEQHSTSLRWQTIGQDENPPDGQQCIVVGHATDGTPWADVAQARAGLWRTPMDRWPFVAGEKWTPVPQT